jgi:alkylation response protein AidB-like acyl-CoA dehydrogenase
MELTETAEYRHQLEDGSALGNRGIGGDLLARARSISGIVSDEAAEGQARAQLTDVVIQALVESELPWALVPRELGGAGCVHAVEIMDAIEEIAFADGSAGWVIMAASFGNGMIAAVMDPETAGSMVGPGKRGILCGAVAPQGRATRVDGGYRVTGRWQFASGANWASYVGGGCIAHDSAGTVIVSNGAPSWVYPLLPIEEVELLGNWQVAGLQGTASWDFAARDVFVPDARVVALPTPVLNGTPSVYQLGFTPTVNAQHSAFALGVVKRAFTEIANVISDKTRAGYDGPIGQSSVFAYEFAQKEAEYQATRAYVRKVFADAHERMTPDGPTAVDTARMQVTCAWMTRVSEDLIKWCNSWAGSATVRMPSVLARCLNDIAVAGNHLYVDRMNIVTGAPHILASWKS